MSLQVSIASRLKHDNVVELLGYCVNGGHCVLAYEYASNGSLRDILHGMWCWVYQSHLFEIDYFNCLYIALLSIRYS